MHSYIVGERCSSNQTLIWCVGHVVQPHVQSGSVWIGGTNLPGHPTDKHGYHWDKRNEAFSYTNWAHGSNNWTIMHFINKSSSWNPKCTLFRSARRRRSKRERRRWALCRLLGRTREQVGRQWLPCTAVLCVRVQPERWGRRRRLLQEWKQRRQKVIQFTDVSIRVVPKDVSVIRDMIDGWRIQCSHTR